MALFPRFHGHLPPGAVTKILYFDLIASFIVGEYNLNKLPCHWLCRYGLWVNCESALVYISFPKIDDQKTTQFPRMSRGIAVSTGYLVLVFLGSVTPVPAKCQSVQDLSLRNSTWIS